MGIRLHHIALILLISLTSCNKDHPGCFSSIGDTSTRSEVTSGFNALEAFDQLDVELVTNSSRHGEVEVIGPENVINQIELEVKDSVLSIKDQNRCRWFREYGRLLIKVYIRDLKMISAYDNSAFISSDSVYLADCIFNVYSIRDQELMLKAGTFELHHRDAATVKLSGYCAVFIPTIYATGSLQSFEMQSDFAFVYHYGLNTVSIHPFKELEANISNTGDVIYNEKPLKPAIRKGQGSGQLIYRP